MWSILWHCTCVGTYEEFRLPGILNWKSEVRLRKSPGAQKCWKFADSHHYWPTFSFSSTSYFYCHQHHCSYYYYIQPNFYFFSPVKSTTDHEGWKKMFVHTEMAQPVPKSLFTALTVWHLKFTVFTMRRICFSFHGEDDAGAEWKAWDKQHLGCRRNKKQLIKENSKRALWVWKEKLKASITKMKPTEALSQQSLVSCIQYLVFSIYLVHKSPPRGATRHTQE